MKTRCLIVDDEPLAREILEQYVKDKAQLVLAGSVTQTSEAAMMLESQAIDILFLDIRMPGESGLEFLRSLASKPVTILTTAFRDFAIEGFELGVMDYLVKPISRERFDLATSRALEFLELKQHDIRELEPPSDKKLIVIKSGTKKISLPLNAITHIQGLKDYSIIHAGSQKYLVKGYIKTLEERFHPDHFIRVHKSFIVARNRIQLINKNKIEIGDFIIPIGELYRKDVENLLGISG